MTAPRATPEYVRERMAAGSDLLLVCAYDDDAKCSQIQLPGSSTLNELRARPQTPPKTTELIFY